MKRPSFIFDYGVDRKIYEVRDYRVGLYLFITSEYPLNWVFEKKIIDFFYVF